MWLNVYCKANKENNDQNLDHDSWWRTVSEMTFCILTFNYLMVKTAKKMYIYVLIEKFCTIWILDWARKNSGKSVKKNIPE